LIRRATFAELVDAAVDVGVVLFEDARHGVDDLPRLLARRRVIQVHEVLSTDLLREDREVRADPLDRERRSRRALDADGHQARPA